MVWRRKFLLLAFLVVGAVLAAARAYTMARTYEGKALLAPVAEGSQQSRLASLVGQFGGVAGGLLSPGDSITTAEHVALLQSQQLVAEFIERNQLLPLLFPRQWDASARKWRGSDPQGVPSLEDGYRLFMEKIMTVLQDRDSGLITVAIRWHDPPAVAEWANGLVALANERIRARAIDEASASIEYLDRELARANVMEIQQSIYRSIEAQLNTKMLASVRTDYAFRVISAATRPDVDNYASPKEALMLVLGLLLGGIVGAVVILLLETRKGVVGEGR